MSDSRADMAVCVYNTEINNQGSEFVKHQVNKKLSTPQCLSPWAGAVAAGAGEQEAGWSGVRGEESVPGGDRAIRVAPPSSVMWLWDADLCQPLRSQLSVQGGWVEWPFDGSLLLAFFEQAAVAVRKLLNSKGVYTWNCLWKEEQPASVLPGMDLKLSFLQGGPYTLILTNGDLLLNSLRGLLCDSFQKWDFVTQMYHNEKPAFKMWLSYASTYSLTPL